MKKWSIFAKTVKGELTYYRKLASDPHTPRVSKWLIGIAIAYLLSPIDLIPDFIPVLGYLDDLIIVPGLICLANALIPRRVRVRVRGRYFGSRL